MEVYCPDNDGAVSGDDDIEEAKPKTVKFHLHHMIVLSSSSYFRTFPEPKTGRVINDVDADSFKICVRFMYLGECDGKLTHDNVASVLNAAELLQIDELKKHCMEYLEHHLEHSNYEQVVELAERYNNPQLKIQVSSLNYIFM